MSLFLLALLVAAAGGTGRYLAWRDRRRIEPDEEAEAIVQDAFDRFRDEATAEYPLVRESREIHGMTAPELAARARDEEWAWSRIVQDLSCDADFMAIARRLDAEFPQT